MPRTKLWRFPCLLCIAFPQSASSNLSPYLSWNTIGGGVRATHTHYVTEALTTLRRYWRRCLSSTLRFMKGFVWRYTRANYGRYLCERDYDAWLFDKHRRQSAQRWPCTIDFDQCNCKKKECEFIVGPCFTARWYTTFGKHNWENSACMWRWIGLADYL